MKSDTMPFFVTDLLVAGSLLTRLPLPHLPDTAFAHAARAVWAYPLAGALLGGLAAAIGSAALWIGLPAVIAAGVVIATLMICSGAMHEDGLADMADGFWGGHSPEQRLAIMKDSHIGTYGTLTLVVVTGLRWMAYAALLLPLGVGVIIGVAVLSRAIMPVLMVALPHARDFGLSHTVGRPEMGCMIAGLGIALGIAFLCLGTMVVGAILGTVLAGVTVGALSKRKIKGQTGDVLGATQQLSEVAILFSLLIHLA